MARLQEPFLEQGGAERVSLCNLAVCCVWLEAYSVRATDQPRHHARQSRGLLRAALIYVPPPLDNPQLPRSEGLAAQEICNDDMRKISLIGYPCKEEYGDRKHGGAGEQYRQRERFSRGWLF